MDRRTDGPRTIDRLPTARIRKSYLKWVVWVFPAAAIIFVAVLLYHDMLDHERLITVYFKNADGVEAGNTIVKCRGAAVGAIKKVALTPDREWVSVGIQLHQDQANLAREGSLFWVVRAQLGAGTVSGLQTVMSGSYVEVRPGTGARTNFFFGADEGPAEKMPEPSVPITLVCPDLSSVQEGSPIYYRGIQTGQVTDFQLSDDGQTVMIHAFIRRPYAPLVREDTVFWNAGGIDVHFGLLHGLDVNAESARALVAGALEFATPTQYGPQATNGAVFHLYEKPDPKWRQWMPDIPLKLPPAAAQGQQLSPRNLPTTSLEK